MTSFALLFEQPLVRAFGWSLLHFVWQGFAVAAVLACVLKLLSRQSAQLRYLVACGGLVLITILPLVTFGYLVMTTNAADHTTTQFVLKNGPAMAAHGSFSGTAGPWLSPIAVMLDRSLPGMLTVWSAGVALFLVGLNIGLIAAQKMKSLATQRVSVELQLAFLNLTHRLGVKRAVRLAGSTLVQVPTLIGWLRPVILIPVGCFVGLSPAQIEAVFAHELAHIWRHDYLVSVLQSLVEAILFYHPAVWWVSTQVRRERENCCDDIAVRANGDSLAYAKALSLLEEYRSAYPVVNLGANGGALAMRIRRLLGYSETPTFSQMAGMTLLVFAITATVLGVGALARAQATTDKQLNADIARASQNVPAQYQKWLDEDVVWIITPEERAKFMKLSNDDERNEFIQQFWERRNAEIPGGQSSFRAEYYHRIAYANQHFAAGSPGWKTDRGRIYIMDGPPDSVDAHSTPGGITNPYEVWHYRVIQESTPPVLAQGTQEYKTQLVSRKDVDMKFVDTCSCGNFKLQTSPEK